MAKRKKKEEKKEEEYEPEAAKKPKAPKKTKTRKTVEKPNGLRIMMSVKDIVKHKKDDKMTMPTFGQIKYQDEKIGTVNCNFNNMTPKSLDVIQKLLGTTLEMETPLILDIYVPKGALLDHYNETVQSTLEDGDEGDE